MAQSADILIVGPNWVGDMVMAEALVAALKRRRPECAIDMLAPQPVLEIASRMPDLRAGLTLPFSPHAPALSERLRLGLSLRGRYREAYVLPGSWVSALVPFIAGITFRYGYLRELRYALINRIVAMPAGRRRRTAEAYLRLGGFSGPPAPRLTVDTANQMQLLASHGLARGAFVALMPGAEGGPAKRWPVAAFAELARRIAISGLKVVLLGGRNDAATTAAIAALAPDAIDLGGRTSLVDAIDLLAAARYGVANDTGLMHVAAAVGTPVVGIYGSTSPDDTPPLSRASAVLSHRLSCSPCHRSICPLGHTQCLVGIAPDEVMSAISGVAALSADTPA